MSIIQRPDRLQTEAWLLRGISSIPGQLRLASGYLSFSCIGSGTAWPFQFRKLERMFNQPGFADAVAQGERAELFRWLVTDVRANVPWYYFGGGIKLAHEAARLRFSFGPPASRGRGLAGAAADLKQIKLMRGRGQLWAEVLGVTRD